MPDRIAHEPVQRSNAAVIAEVALTAGTAYLVGLCLAIGVANPDAPAIQLVLVIVGIGLVFGYGLWLLGTSGALLAALSVPLLILSVDALLLAFGFLDLDAGGNFFGPGLGGVLPPLLAVLAAATALACGLALPGPRRLRGVHGATPTRRVSVNTSPVLSQGAVMERLRTTPQVSATQTEATGVWFDDSTDQQKLLPSRSQARRLGSGALRESGTPSGSGTQPGIGAQLGSGTQSGTGAELGSGPRSGAPPTTHEKHRQ